MSPGEWLAIIIAIGSILSNIYQQRTSVRQKDVERRDANNQADFERLTKECERLAKALGDVRGESDRMFQVQIQLRQDLVARDDVISALKRDLADERQLSADREKLVATLQADNARFAKALEDARIPIPPRPKTGPLPGAPNGN